MAGDVRVSPEPLASFSATVLLTAPTVVTNDPIDCSWSVIGSGRSRSFPGDCTPRHPSVHPLAIRQALRRPILDRLAPEYSVRPSCEAKLVLIRPTSLVSFTSKGSTPDHGLSKVRWDRDQRHDRCNHISRFLFQLIEPACSSFAVSAASIVRRGCHGRTRRAWLAVPSSLMLPGLQGSLSLSIRQMMVAVRRITATLAILEPRRRLIR